jgi:hypothetical protein
MEAAKNRDEILYLMGRYAEKAPIREKSYASLSVY